MIVDYVNMDTKRQGFIEFVDHDAPHIFLLKNEKILSKNKIALQPSPHHIHVYNGKVYNRMKDFNVSRVLLVTVDETHRLLNAHTLNEIINDNRVLKIIVFIRNGGQQALVQFTDTTAATEVARRVHGLQIPIAGKPLKVEYSDQDNLIVDRSGPMKLDLTVLNVANQCASSLNHGVDGTSCSTLSSSSCNTNSNLNMASTNSNFSLNNQTVLNSSSPSTHMISSNSHSTYHHQFPPPPPHPPQPRMNNFNLNNSLGHSLQPSILPFAAPNSYDTPPLHGNGKNASNNDNFSPSTSNDANNNLFEGVQESSFKQQSFFYNKNHPIINNNNNYGPDFHSHTTRENGSFIDVNTIQSVHDDGSSYQISQQYKDPCFQPNIHEKYDISRRLKSGLHSYQQVSSSSSNQQYSNYAHFEDNNSTESAADHRPSIFMNESVIDSKVSFDLYHMNANSLQIPCIPNYSYAANVTSPPPYEEDIV